MFAGFFLLILAGFSIFAVMFLKDRVTRLSVHRRVHPFTVSDFSGRTFQLGIDPAAKSAFLFFEPSCSHCQAEVSHFDTLTKFNSLGLKVYAISLSSADKTRQFAQEQGEQSFYIAGPGTASQLGITKIPVLMLVDRDGTIQDIEQGEQSPAFQHYLLSRFAGNLPIDKNDSLVPSTH